MATSMVTVPKDTWTLVSAVSVSFQIPEQHGAFAIESVALPTTLDIRRKIAPSKIYTFQKLDGDLYMFSKDADIEVSVEPLQ